MQRLLFDLEEHRQVVPFKAQLLKWIGNKQRYAHEIVAFFPERFGTYFEPFLGGGGVLGTLAPATAVASDAFRPLLEIWQTLRTEPAVLNQWYGERWHALMEGDRTTVYEQFKAAYNTNPNGADLLFLCRSCYGGVVRFRKADGYMSTPCGIHTPIPPEAFARRVEEWHRRTRGTAFHLLDFEEAMELAKPGDVVYCDPPYSHSQRILYGSQAFSLQRLFRAIERCKSRGVFVAVSIDGTKKSGDLICKLSLPQGLFEREVLLPCGRSMLKRFQMAGQTLEAEVVADRLLLTY
jgi:DNA adenine methylase